MRKTLIYPALYGKGVVPIHNGGGQGDYSDRELRQGRSDQVLREDNDNGVI